VLACKVYKHGGQRAGPRGPTAELFAEPGGLGRAERRRFQGQGQGLRATAGLVPTPHGIEGHDCIFCAVLAANILYLASAPPEQRGQAQQAWTKLLQDGKLPPRQPPPPGAREVTASALPGAAALP
jgi:hypothetical protein